MSLAQPAPDATRACPGERQGSLSPLLVPQLREYRVVPLREHRKARALRLAFYAACFLAGIATGLWTAGLIQSRAAARVSEQPTVIIRTLR